jgi:RHS repeat-associated protein
VGTYYYYVASTASSPTPLTPQNLLNSLASGLASLSSVAGEGVTTLANPTSSPLLAALTSSISNEDVPGTSKPQAYLNWMLLDNQFNLVPNANGNNQNGAQQVGAAGLNGSALQAPLAQPITAAKSGYLYIYLSNTTPGWDVFFDNLSVLHYSSPLIEENHYYPFGLTMAGISDQAIKTQYAVNKYRFQKQELQNKEFSDGSGLEMYEFKYRMDDPQIGRFWSVDPLSSKYVYNSPYAFSEDKVTNSVELEGLEAALINNDFWRQVEGELHSFATMIDKGLTFGNKTTVEVPVTPKAGSTSNTVTTTATTTVNTNLDENLSYLINNNSNAGNPAPFVKTDTKIEVNAGTKVDVKTPVGTASSSATVDQNGKVSVTTSASIKTETPVNVTMTGSQSSDGTSKVGMGVSMTTSNTTLKGGFVIGTNQKTGFIEFNMGGEQKVGNTKVTNTTFIKIGQTQ